MDENGAREVRVVIRATRQEIEDAAAAGASWKDLARLIGCTDRTLRTWRALRDSQMHEKHFPPDPLEVLRAQNEVYRQRELFVALATMPISADDLPPPAKPGSPPGEITEVLDAIDAGRARGKRKLLDALTKLGKAGDAKTLIYLLNRFERFERFDDPDAESQ